MPVMGTELGSSSLQSQEDPAIPLPIPSGRVLTLAAAAIFVVAACTSTASLTPAAPSDGTAAATPDPTTQTAVTGWRDIELTDVATGDTFTLASLEGNVVAVEPFAVWCTNCHVQQNNVQAVYEDLEAAGVKFVSLGIEPNESPDRIADYQERRGYEWTFAQSPLELSRALADEFGPQILAVPSTPLIVLAADGQVVFQDFGFHGPDSLRQIFEEAAS